MISVEEALDLVEQHVKIAQPKYIPLKDTLGLILAEDTKSPINMPPFDQSAMDGYAVNFEQNIDTYTVIGEVQAGSSEVFELKAGEAVRIFTGAAVPEMANVVVKQEDVARVGEQISFTGVKAGENIRPKGEQIKVGDVALKEGCEMNPAAIGFLATLGYTKALVYPKPKITIFSTGNELVKPGETLAHGQIYESNSIMLETAFNYFGFRDIEIVYIPDNYEATVEHIERYLSKSDVLILSGGISVGEYDFVGKALRELKVDEVFYKVKQKPGKPIYFGKKDGKLIYALPGNPAAALTSFYIYILPTLNMWTGGEFTGCVKTELPLAETYKRKGDRTVILKAEATDTEVRILSAQSSAMLSSFAEANALVVIHEEQDVVEAGDFVVVLLL